MRDGHAVIDADSHKCENPLVFADYVEAPFRDRIGFVRDRFGEQRIRILDRDPKTGSKDFERLFLQPEGYGKGTYRPYHEESTLGGLFNRVRMQHLDREGIDHQVIYGSVALAFNSVLDPELATALCRAYNDYIHDDCAPHRQRLHPVGTVPLQDPSAAVEEMGRCVDQLDMPAVWIPPNVAKPHPGAPERFPEIRVPKQLSDPDFEPIWSEAERLDVAVALHGAPGLALAGGISDQLDSFTLVHVFANRNMQQMAIAKLIFDGVFEAHPQLRVGFLEAGCGWLPDLVYSLREHWEKRILRFDPDLEPSPAAFLREFALETARSARPTRLPLARRLLGMLFTASDEAATAEELERFRYEHPKLTRDPLEYFERGQIFLTIEPGDPSVAYLPLALGALGRRLCGLAVDYGHWDAEVKGCVGRTAVAAGSADYAARLLSSNAIDFYGDRLRRHLEWPRQLQQN